MNCAAASVRQREDCCEALSILMLTAWLVPLMSAFTIRAPASSCMAHGAKPIRAPAPSCMVDVAKPILVLGATGKVGQCVVEQLSDSGQRVRALARDQNSQTAGRLAAMPGVDVVPIDKFASLATKCRQIKDELEAMMTTLQKQEAEANELQNMAAQRKANEAAARKATSGVAQEKHTEGGIYFGRTDD